MIGYRNATDRKVGFAFAALIITVVGSAATMLIVHKLQAFTWDTDDRYEKYLAAPTEAQKPGTLPARP